jgi:hypothetical protein
MTPNENNTEPYELKSYGRKLDPEDLLKDRLIIRHLRQRKNNFLFDFGEPQKDRGKLGEVDE